MSVSGSAFDKFRVAFVHSLRMSGDYPSRTGKAYDTSLLCKWLCEELQLVNPQDVVPRPDAETVHIPTSPCAPDLT